MARTPASRKIGRVLALLALFWAGQQAVQTVRAAVGVRAVPFARPPAGAWARKPLIARGAASKADGQPDEVDDNEDDEVSKLAKEHDAVQSYDAKKVIRWVKECVGITDREEIEKLAQEKYAGSDLLMMSVAELDIHQRCKRKLDNAGADEDRITIVGDMLSALVDLKAKDLLKAAIAVIKEQLKQAKNLKDDQDRIAMVGDMLSALVDMDAVDVMRSALEVPVVQSVLKAALDVSKDDVGSYGPKKVAAWIAAKLVSAQYDYSEIQQALRKLARMNGNQVLTVTQDQLKKNYKLEVAKAEFLVDAVQGLNDPSAVTFLSITQKETYVSYNHENKVWVYGSLLSSIPGCGYVPRAQKLESTTGGQATVVDSMQDGKRSIPVFFGESGSGKSVQAMLAPALKLAENFGSPVRVFSIILHTEDCQDRRLQQITSETDSTRRNALCIDFVVKSFINQVQGGLPKKYTDDIVNKWLEDENRNTTALGTIVFIIDEIGKCLELARGIASARDAIYNELGKYCERALLVMAGTSAAAILGPGAGSAEIASDPDSVSLVRVGDVQGDDYLSQLLTATLPLPGFTLSDVRSVNFLRPYLSNARTAWILFEELRRFTEVPAAVDSDKVLQIWKRLPWDAGCYVPLRYRTLNGLQRFKSVEAREAVARNALKLLMHPEVVSKDDMPSVEDALVCVQLGLCSVSNYSAALELLRDKSADTGYRSTVHFSSSRALAHMLLAAFDVPTIIPEDGDCLEALVAESERRFSEVLTGKKATTMHLPYPFPPNADKGKTSGVPQNLFRKILEALISGETVVLLNGPKAQGADVIVLRRACNGKRPLVRLLQIQNRKKPVGSLNVLGTLGVGARQNRKNVQPAPWSERVLAWLCRLVSEQPEQGSALQEQFQNVSEVARIPVMDVYVELVLLERANQLSGPFPTVMKPSFLQSCPIFKLLNLSHLVPFPTDMALINVSADFGQIQT